MLLVGRGEDKQMRCPNCKTKLKKHKQYGYWSCPRCYGEWWPYSPGDSDDPGHGCETDRPAICPRCKRLMRKVSSDGLAYWRCSNCKGQWWEPARAREQPVEYRAALGIEYRSGPEPLSFRYVPGHGKGGRSFGRKRKKKKWLLPPSDRYRLY